MIIVKQLGDLVVKVGLEGVTVDIYWEMVCGLREQEVKGKVICKVEKKVKHKDINKALRYYNKARDIVDGFTGINIKIYPSLGVGDEFLPITEV